MCLAFTFQAVSQIERFSGVLVRGWAFRPLCVGCGAKEHPPEYLTVQSVWQLTWKREVWESACHTLLRWLFSAVIYYFFKRKEKSWSSCFWRLVLFSPTRALLSTYWGAQRPSVCGISFRLCATSPRRHWERGERVPQPSEISRASSRSLIWKYLGEKGS